MVASEPGEKSKWFGATVCAWCSKELRAGNPTEPLSHGICVECLGLEPGMEVEDLLHLDPGAADALPWGLIRIRGDGEIVHYNSEEGRLSGRRPEDVIGRHFFRDIAPCTFVQNFAGRLYALRAARRNGGEVFDFLFRFPGRMTYVSIYLSYCAADDMSALVIRKIA